MRPLFAVLTLLLLPIQSIYAQDLGLRPLQKLIDCPTAGCPERSSYDFELRAYPDGGVLAGFTIGLFDRAGLGLFYGGTGIIGFSNPEWNGQPGIAASLRIIDESFLFPALAFGFSNQGYGAWIDSTDRYQFKAKGFYAVFGKNYALSSLGEFGLHVGLNKNTIAADDNSLDYFAAVDFRVLSSWAVIGEYSAALDDKQSIKTLGGGKGYLNLGFRWTFGERLALDMNLRDVLINQEGNIRGGGGFGRELRVSYVERF